MLAIFIQVRYMLNLVELKVKFTFTKGVFFNLMTPDTIMYFMGSLPMWP